MAIPLAFHGDEPFDSGEYEQWARKQLLDATGEVNLQGYEIVGQLNALSDFEA